MSIQTIAMLDFGDTLHTQGLEAILISLKIWEALITLSMTLELIGVLVFSVTCAYECIGPEGLLKELLLDGFFPLFFAEELPLDELTEFSEEGILENSVGLVGRRRVDFLLDGVIGTLVVNSSLILSQNVFCPSLTSKLSHLPLKIKETSSNVTLPKPVKHRILSSLWFLR